MAPYSGSCKKGPAEADPLSSSASLELTEQTEDRLCVGVRLREHRRTDLDEDLFFVVIGGRVADVEVRDIGRRRRQVDRRDVVVVGSVLQAADDGTEGGACTVDLRDRLVDLTDGILGAKDGTGRARVTVDNL